MTIGRLVPGKRRIRTFPVLNVTGAFPANTRETHMLPRAHPPECHRVQLPGSNRRLGIDQTEAKTPLKDGVGGDGKIVANGGVGSDGESFPPPVILIHSARKDKLKTLGIDLNRPT